MEDFAQYARKGDCVKKIVRESGTFYTLNTGEKNPNLPAGLNFAHKMELFVGKDGNAILTKLGNNEYAVPNTGELKKRISRLHIKLGIKNMRMESLHSPLLQEMGIAHPASLPIKSWLKLLPSTSEIVAHTLAITDDLK